MKPVAVARAEKMLGSEAETWARVERKGWSKSEHWTIGLADGSRAFVKTGSIDPIPEWLRQERNVYAAVDGPFMPRFLGFEDGPEPLLVLEDLIPAHWPPPWRDGDVELVLDALAQLATISADLPRLEREHPWQHVERTPEAFLSTRLRDERWLEDWLPRLQAAADAAPIAGDGLIHGDVRSDNLCFKDGRCVLVDWNHATVGNPRFDIAAWAASLALEHGPKPWTLGVDEFAAYIAGFFAARAGLPKPPGAPTVRDFQRLQAEIALDWVERVL